MYHIHFGHGTHIGLVRTCNEDRYICLPAIGLWVIADGMGGHSAGDVASSIAIREITGCVERGMPLADAILSAHRSILATSRQDRRLTNMGTTVVALRMDGMRYEIAWVGDSRAYLWNGLLHRMTKDHSYIQTLIDAGEITEAEASSHPKRHVILQALGTGGIIADEIKVDRLSGTLAPEDTLLLCSDGLSGELTDDEIAAVLGTTEKNQPRVDRLIAAALKAGGRDNITLIALAAA